MQSKFSAWIDRQQIVFAARSSLQTFSQLQDERVVKSAALFNKLYCLMKLTVIK